MNTNIYVLKDPRDNEVRYVGKANDVEKRYRSHLCVKSQKNTYKDNWIKSLFSLRLKPILEIIEECSEEVWQERERYWIKYYRDLGCRITNLTDGGEGCMGLSEDTRKRISDKQKGKYVSPETRKKISIANSGRVSSFLGRKHSDEVKKRIGLLQVGREIPDRTKEKISKTMKGILFSDEHKRNISLSLLGKKLSEEHKKTLSLKKFGTKKSNSSSVYMGVSKTGWGKWKSSVYYDKRRYNIGNFELEIDAARARDLYIIENGLQLKLNFDINGNKTITTPEGICRESIV